MTITWHPSLGDDSAHLESSLLADVQLAIYKVTFEWPAELANHSQLGLPVRSMTTSPRVSLTSTTDQSIGVRKARKEASVASCDLSGLGLQYLLDPGEPGDGGGKRGGSNGQESDVTELVGRDPQLKGPARIGSDRSLRQPPDGDAQFDEPLGSLLQRPGRPSGRPEGVQGLRHVRVGVTKVGVYVGKILRPGIPPGGTELRVDGGASGLDRRHRRLHTGNAQSCRYRARLSMLVIRTRTLISGGSREPGGALANVRGPSPRPARSPRRRESIDPASQSSSLEAEGWVAVGD